MALEGLDVTVNGVAANLKQVGDLPIAEALFFKINKLSEVHRFYAFACAMR